MTHHVDVNLGRTGQGAEVWLDGEDISGTLRGVWVGAHVGEATKVELLLAAPTVDAHVETGELRWIHEGCEHCRGHEVRP